MNPPLYLPEDEYFALTANITSTGYQTVALSGYLVSRRPDGTYVAPLIPQLFYGADGSQLTTWRQNFTSTGSQVILSRSSGKPFVPKSDLWWRKVSEPPREARREEPTALVEVPPIWVLPSWVGPAVVVGGLAFAGLVLYAIIRH